MGVRLRALVLLLALTMGDYLLWDWSIADGHDILSLVAGLTLIPLATVSLGQLVLTCGRLLRLLIGGAQAQPHSQHARSREDARGPGARTSTHESDSPSGRLAA
jgi:hypothetical protein